MRAHLFGMYRRVGSRLPLAAAALYGASTAGCTDDKTALVALMTQAAVPERYYDDIAASGAGSVFALMSLGEAKLSTEPPHAPTLHALLAQASSTSALPTPDAMPKRDGSNFASTPHGDADGAKAGYTALHAQMVMLCRLAAAFLPTLVAERARSVDPDAAAASLEKAERDKELEEAKDPIAKATMLRKASFKTYNVHFGVSRHERRATDEQLVRTHQALKRHRLSVASLSSSKYGKLSAIERPVTTLTVADSTLVATEEHKPLGRYSETLQSIYACVDSLVEAGLVDIDKTAQHLAAETHHGTLCCGRQVEFDLQSGMALRAAYLALSDCMGGKALALHWEEQYISPASSDMMSGHSLASATIQLLSTSAMRPSENLAVSLGILTEKAPLGASSSSPTPYSARAAVLSPDGDLAKAQRRIVHLERQEKDMKEAKGRRLEADRANKRGFNSDRQRSGAYHRDQREYESRDYEQESRGPRRKGN